ncbi:MAG TPA: histone deacetylase [Candidatus Eisenbacteria bacterium]|nr:histone deacetylase [Candidatus Eisenbacteria bacterium]
MTTERIGTASGPSHTKPRPAVVHHDGYFADIGMHVFPMRKYRLVREEIVRRGLVRDEEILAPAPATVEQVRRVHDQAYVDKLLQGRLSALEEAVLELPYSKELVEASFLCAGGSILAAGLALERGMAIHIGGGLHHAFPDHGEGFCVLNDVAIALRDLLATRRIRRAAVIDLDVHQGNGTAAIFRDDPTVFTFSIHEQDNYPAIKPPSDLDVGLQTHAGSEEYLAALRHHVPRILDRVEPDLVAYVAGADPFEEDQLGRLLLAREDLRARDRLVLDACVVRDIPVFTTLAGGYARDVRDTVGIHADLVVEAFRIFGAHS